MAHVTTNETEQRRNGKPVSTFTVHWDEYLPDTDGDLQRHKRQATFRNRADADALCDELNAARHTVGGTSGVSDARRAAAMPFAHYAAGWLAEQRRRHAEGTLKIGTLNNYTRILDVDILPRFGMMPVGLITLVDCEEFRADLASRINPRSLRNVWWPLTAVLRYAMRARAIQSSPADAVDRAPAGRRSRVKFKPHPLTPTQVATLAAKVGEISHPAYELMVLFLCYTGLRRGELQGLTLADLTLTHAADGGVTGSIRVERSAVRRGGKLDIGLTKTENERTVPLPPWLAARMHTYLTATHGDRTNPAAPLWPNRLQGGARRKGHHAAAQLDWSETVELSTFARRTLRDACQAVGIPVGTARKLNEDGTVTPPTNGFRLHDTRHTFAVMLLTAGVNIVQVSKWCGHANKNMTLAVYADFLPEEAPVNPLGEPVAAPTPKVVQLFG